MMTKFRHANIVSADWEALADFYCEVFECKRIGPTRYFSGPHVSSGTGIPGAVIEGAHLALPGGGPDGPTLEIFKYNNMAELILRRANTPGFAHIAFEVPDVAGTAKKVVDFGGRLEGSIARQAVNGVGEVEFVYVRDPDGNLIELQAWVADDPGITCALEN